ncbi:MAG: PA14 domain-containing protein, partial [Ferruginibacter sp.]
IIVRQSNVNYGAYGTGAKPVITGLSTVTGWVNLGGNIWEAPVSNVKSGVNLVLRNDAIQPVGRYPNTDDANGGYLTYTGSTTSSITGPALSSTTNWTGAEVAIRINRWDIRKQLVTSHSGGVVSFASKSEVPRVGYGYFFQRDPRTLDKDGEWWHNAANNKLRMYFSSNDPNSYSIQISTVDTLFTSTYGSLSISNLSFDGSGKKSIWTNGGSGITIKDCNVNNSGIEAITAMSSSNVSIDNCIVTNNLGSGIRVYNTGAGKVNLSVTRCTVDKTSFIAGMEPNDGLNGGAGIYCIASDGLTIQNNIVTNCGYTAIAWQGNNVYIKYNYVNTYCSLRDDGGGIYTVEKGGNVLPTRSNRNIISNIVVNGIGANYGSNDPIGTSARGLYFDLGTRNVLVDSNTAAYNIGGAEHGNNNASLTFTNNVFFGNGKTFSVQRFADADLVRKMVIKKNILYPYIMEYRNLGLDAPVLITPEDDILAMGTIDSNYYSINSAKDLSLTTITTNTDRSNYTLTTHNFAFVKDSVGIEKHSTNVVNTGTLEYNASSSPKVVSFSGFSKKDVFGNVYNNSVTIPAWSSKVLIPNGTATTSNKAPVANAGANKVILLPINTLTLTGSGTDPDGTITGYSWKKISGPATGSILTPLAAITGLINLVQGAYQYELTVTDNQGSTAKDTMQVTVNPLIVNNFLPAVNPANTVNGLDYKYYEGNWTILPAFSSLTPVKTGVSTNFDLSPADRATQYGFSFSGFIDVPADGQYTFYTSSDDGSDLFIDDILTVSNDGIHTTIEKAGTIGLKAGKHSITGLFFQQTGGEVFVVSYEGAGVSKQAIPASSLYRVENLLPAVNPANTINGLVYQYYEGNWSVLPAFPTLTPVKTGAVTNFDLSPANRSTQFGFSFSGFIDVPLDGQYTFYTSSDDGSNLYIDDSLTVSNDGLHTTTEKAGTIGLKAGKHAITGLFFRQTGSGAFLVSYQGTGISKQAIPASSLYRVEDLLPAVNPANTINGLEYIYYEGNWSVLPVFSAQTPVKKGSVLNFDLSPANRTTQYGFNFSGFIDVPADGQYTFYTTSDDGSNLYIDDSLTVSNDGLHASVEKSGTIGLKAGKHAITGLFFQQTGSEVFLVSYESSGISKQAIPASSLFRVDELLPAVNPANTVNGLDYKYYEGDWNALPSFSTLTPVEMGSTSTFDITLANRSAQFGFSFTGFINVPSDGQYTFYTTSDDGSNLYIDNILTVENDGIHGPMEQSGTIGLKAGKHYISALYFEQTGNHVFVVSYEGIGISKRVIPASALYRVNNSLNLLPAVNPANTVNGLDYKYYEGNWTVLPSFSLLTPVKTGTASTFDLSLANRATQFGFSFTGFINVPSDGIYTFYTTSDDGSKLLIDNLLTVTNDGIHGPTEKSGIIGLKAGKHAITGLFFEQTGGQVFLVSYESVDVSKQSIPLSSLYRINTIPAARITNGISLGSGISLNIVNNVIPKEALKISSFPNPSSSEFRLSVKGGSDEKIEILVMSADGRTVFKASGSSNKIYKFGNSFERGVYVIKVVQSNAIQSLKVIKD